MIVYILRFKETGCYRREYGWNAVEFPYQATLYATKKQAKEAVSCERDIYETVKFDLSES